MKSVTHYILSTFFLFLLSGAAKCGDNSTCRDQVVQLVETFPIKVKIQSQQEEAGGIGPWATRAIFDRGSYVAVTAGDRNVRVWNLENGHVVADFLDGGSIIVAGAEPGTLLIGDASKWVLYFWNINTSSRFEINTFETLQ